MSQVLSQVLSQQMRLEQRLTPQLIQSMAVLQKPVADLETYIAEALESNPALEAEGPPADTAEGRRPGRHPRTQPPDDEGTRFARLERYSREYELDWAERPPVRALRVQSSGERDAKVDAMANTAGRAVSLNEYLSDQWSLVEHADPVARQAGLAIINHIDPDGCLRVRLDEISRTTRPSLPLEALEVALRGVQQLDPPGVGARDMVECLLLQLDALPGDNTIEKTLVRNHLDDLARNRLPAIAKATGFTVGEINEALRAMRSTLHLHPGLQIGDRPVPTIRPDVIVEYAETGGGVTVRLARGNLPALRISDEVLALAKSRGNGKETRDFARKHVEAAGALIDAVAFRSHRLLDVARAIVEKQREFFELGPQGLKVLRMSDLAAELECDPSTISRTVADKYMQTPRGVFPLRYFFTGGTETGDGETTSWDSVKVRVRDLIDGEDRKAPLKDDQIAAKLSAEGIDISRRTVAKYRQQLNIPSARHRREF
ncbi:MAG TPA: RNA polymerase factor sigma-54 [Phycisphaerae bacterium]|nr:RNA polymerase factor sigma-54 [Phycisphaerae bacterium]HNU43748.1 RNA polymerase factor sigma-54 [Phycisphaerae bacterium]